MPPALRKRPNVPARAAARPSSPIPTWPPSPAGLVTVGRRGGR